MTQSRSVTLWCDGTDDDGEPCPARYGDAVRVETAARLREMAAADGWTNDGARDYCPDCSGD